MIIERTFFVKIALDTGELGDLEVLAADIQDDLISAGYNVIQVDLRDGDEPTTPIQGEFNL